MTVLTLTTLLAIGGASCRRGNTPEETSDAPQQEIDDRFTLDNVTLEQSNEQGQIVWRVEATRATYSQDQQTAEIENPDGELYQDGEAVYQVSGDSGVVRQDGERIILSGNINATDLRSGAVLQGGELVWVPEEETLTIRKGLTGTHPDITIEARQAQLFSQDQRVELQGNVVAEVRDPRVRLSGDRLNWLTEEQRITSNRRVNVERLRGQGDQTQVTDQLAGDQLNYRLDTQTLTMRNNVEMVVRNPVMDLVTDTLVWKINDQLLTINSPLEANLRNGQVNLTGNQGEMDLEQEIFRLRGNVQATTRRNQSQLRGDRLIWDNTTQEVEAIGNVFYTQADPAMTTTAPRLTGTLNNQVFVMSGGRVVTEFIPAQQ
jgi:LPS export ABC transporter protein LptC